MKKFTLIIFLLFAVGQMQAQTNKEKELQKMEQEVASGKLSDEEMFQKYDALTQDYFARDSEKMFYYCRKGIAFAHEKKNVKQEAKFLTLMGKILIELDVRDSVGFYLDKALKLIEGKEYYEEESANYRAKANLYFDLNDYENAMKAYLKAMEATQKDKAQKMANKQSIDQSLHDEVHLLNLMSTVYAYMYNDDKHLEYLLKAKKVIEDNPTVDFDNVKPIIFLNLADLYMFTKQYDNVLPLLEESYKLVVARESTEAMLYALRLFLLYYEHEGDMNKAFAYGKQALQLAEKTNLPHAINTTELALMQLYSRANDYKTSIYYAERLLNKLQEDDLNYLPAVYQYLAINYAHLGNAQKAVTYMNKFVQKVRETSDERMQNAIHEMEVKYDVQQKDLEIARKQAENERHQKQRFIFIGGLALSGLLLASFAYLSILRRRRIRELTEMNAMKDKFFSIISHDLKNPVIAQRDALQLLLDNSEKWDVESLIVYYHELLKSADNQVTLLFNLLNWAQVQTGRMPYRPTHFDLTAVLQPDIAIIQNMAARKGITCEINIPQNTIITGDDNMLVMVIRNLLTNAVKFTHEGGNIALHISSDMHANVIHGAPTKYTVAISDTGIGMSAEQMQNIFRTDAKYSKPGTAGEQGSGLGLLVCKELLEKHGAKLHVESEEGKGSRFWFEICA